MQLIIATISETVRKNSEKVLALIQSLIVALDSVIEVPILQMDPMKIRFLIRNMILR